MLGSGGCVLEMGGSRRLLSEPRLVHDEQRRLVPAPVRFLLRRFDVADFHELTPGPRSHRA